MYKMVVSDFCGTLIDSEEAISVSTMLELDRIRKEGILFCITTNGFVREGIFDFEEQHGRDKKYL